MGRKSHTRALSVWMNGEKVGRWSFGPAAVQEFLYEASWLRSERARPISLSMPLRPGTEPYRAGVSEYFENLLPDNDDIRRRMQQRFGAESARPFDLLTATGRDCVGAIQIVPEDEQPPDVRQITGYPIEHDQVADVLRATLGTGFGHQGMDDNSAFRLSLAGAQEKTALLWHEEKWHIPTGATPTTHLIKLPIGHLADGLDLATSVENEWLCAHILEAYGIAAAACSIQVFGEFKTLVVERFDRKLSADGRWWLRLPQEDLCQANGLPSVKKYENDGGPGILKTMDLLLGSSEAESDRRDFMKRQVIFWLLAAIDGHAKNFSIFLQPGGRFQLTPSYDVLSAHPMLGHGRGLLPPQKITMAMALEGKSRHYEWSRIKARHWLATAKMAGFAGMHGLLAAVIEDTPRVLGAVKQQLPRNFPAKIASAIFSGIKTAADALNTELKEVKK